MVSSSIIQQSQSILSINQFLNIYQDIYKTDLDKILSLDFEFDRGDIKNYTSFSKILPIIEIAKKEDAEVVSNLYKESYNGTYPYKQMEDANSIIDLIDSPNDHLFVFRLNTNEIIGAFSSHLELDKKRGLMHGFVIKKEYRKIIDSLKAFLGSSAYLWKKYQKEIFIWYGEIRTDESTAQFATSLFGLKPIAFLPNKDIFFNKVESDILHVIYNQKALLKYRKKQQPQILRQVLNSYVYTNNRFKLGLPIVKNPIIELNQARLDMLKSHITINIKELEHGIEEIIILNELNKNFYKFLYNPYSKNFEKSSYKIESLEELYLFLENLLKLFKEWNINYAESYVSAYNVEEQKLFYNLGFRARGYVPAWEYNSKDNIFEDRIVFNYFKGNVFRNMRLISEVEELINILNEQKDQDLQVI
ncbi:MAG: hypothetical protein EU532_12805 [Promethearchaeota archaeon]|nr:MAG: hypothetical protein EU532_12805 [Candidatus Lokiarchaeota archaeon]